MNRSVVDQVASAVLYEGYILYPYRASAVKNRQRFNFGGLYPPVYSHAQAGTDACRMQTECLVLATERTALDVRVRFLHLLSREVGRRVSDDYRSQDAAPPVFEAVESVTVAGRDYHTWQEAIEREVATPGVSLSQIAAGPLRRSFSFGAGTEVELLRNSAGEIVAAVTRKQQDITGAVEIAACDLGGGLVRVRVAIENETPLDASPLNREEAIVRSLASTHTILGVHDGEFVSLFDPPEPFREAAAACNNVGTWPVLVGSAEERDTVLSSPIILYDYPQIAAESAGDLYDGTEIDEILTLRIMSLTDQEKREMRSVDDRAREILERTEMLPEEHLAKLHGAIRGLRPAREEVT